MAHRHTFGALVVAVSLACSGADAPATEAEVAEWTLGDQPAVSVGVRSGESEYELFRVVSATRLSDGSLVIANAGSYEVRFYDADGRFLRSAGGRGGGPGEFENIESVHRTRGDSVAVWDNLARRITYFDRSGQRGRDFRFTELGASIEVNSVSVPALAGDVAFREDGAFVVAPTPPVWALSGLRIDDEGYGRLETDSIASDGVWRFELPVFLYDSEGRPTGRSLPLQASEFTVHEGRYQPRQFGHRFNVTGGSEKLIVWTGKPAEVIELDLNGDALVRPLPVAARAATEEGREAEIERSLRYFAESGHSDMRELYLSVALPDSLPSIASVRVDDEGQLWVEEYLSRTERDVVESVRWRVFSPEGTMRASVSVPAELNVFDVSFGFVTGVVRDEFDVERVDSWRVERVGGAF